MKNLKKNLNVKKRLTCKQNVFSSYSWAAMQIILIKHICSVDICLKKNVDFLSCFCMCSCLFQSQ